jgi:hypothetical protein
MQPNTRRPLFQKSPALRLGLTVGIGLLLVGCGKHYWSKPGAGPSDFNRESAECARENSVQMTANKDYGIVIADLYKMCLKSRGWNRAQQLEPPPGGWFRGIEEDGPMKLEPPAAAPQPATPRSDLPGVPAETVAELVGTWTGELIRSSINARATNPAVLRIFEEESRLRGSLEVRGFDLTGSGDVVKSGPDVSLSGKFGHRALPITFTLIVNGAALEASGIAANNTIYRLSFQKR